MDNNNSSKNEKEEKQLRKLLRDLHGVSGPRSSGSLKDQVLKRNFLSSMKSTDVPPGSNYMSVSTKTKGLHTEAVNEYDEKSTLLDAPISKKPKYDACSRSNIRKLQFDSEIEDLRKTVQSCYAAMQPVQCYTDMRLKYYASISDSNCIKGKKLNQESRKRKSIQNESHDKISEEIKFSDTEDSSGEEDDTKIWTSEVDGTKMIFKRINENNLL